MSDVPARSPFEMPDPWRTVAQPVVVVDPLSYRREGLQLLVVTAYCAIVGGLAGVIWAAIGNTATLTPKKGAVYLPSDDKFLLDNDLRFALVVVVAGLLCGVVLTVVGRESWIGPGAALGLAAGGILGALVAAHVGHVIGSHALTARIFHLAPGANPARVKAAVASIDFKVGWWIGLIGWPFAALAVVAGVLTFSRTPQPATGWLYGAPQ